jgi:3,4-dihydroxy-9,10-secoandrosta-1,3,5(10)-triene-9,17-dione 4,5-dioxygenase
MTVRELAYVGIETPAVDQWTEFATNVLGMASSTHGHDRWLRLDERPWRIAVAPAERNRVSFIGWAVDDRAGFERLLDATGAQPEPTLAVARGVETLAVFVGPGGLVNELVLGHQLGETPFTSPLGHRFVAGAEGLGHLLLVVPSLEDAVALYVDGCGMRISDTYSQPPVDIAFLRCNRRHHSIALAEFSLPDGVGPRPGDLLHLMVEVDDLDAVGRAYDACVAGAAPLTQRLGRHTNDRMTSFYVQSPSGLEIEFGFGGVEVDDSTWQVQELDAVSSWGHQNVGAASHD